jgi:2-polyprenyl-3-methyl-5-hydroxy-6-metoxy-1,4-benzoquinol methylase
MNSNNKAIMMRISSLFARRWMRFYSRGKLRHDPAFPTAFEKIGESSLPLLDIGCGVGLLAFYLRERGFAPEVLGLDVDERKIREGQVVAGQHYTGISLQTGDAAALPEFSGNVAMLDVLHYLSPSAQQTALLEMAKRVAPGCWCFVRTTPNDGSWRFRFTQIEESFAQAISWMTRPVAAFPTLAHLESCFPATEFDADVRPLWGSTPFNSWLLAFRRR